MTKDYILYPENSMVWVYQSNRYFTEDEKMTIENKMNDFISQWDSHGSLVKGTFTIKNEVFLIVFADGEGHALCGRAQSASVNLVKELEQDLGIELLNRMNLSYKDGETVKLIKMSDLKKLYADAIINDDTIVFDNTVINKKDFDDKWEVKLKDSWCKRFV